MESGPCQEVCERQLVVDPCVWTERCSFFNRWIERLGKLLGILGVKLLAKHVRFSFCQEVDAVASDHPKLLFH